MAKIKKVKKADPLFFDFAWNYVPQLFLGGPWAEKMTFSQKTGHVWFGDTYFLNPWCLMVNLPYWSPLATSLKLFCTSAPMCEDVNLIVYLANANLSVLHLGGVKGLTEKGIKRHNKNNLWLHGFWPNSFRILQKCKKLTEFNVGWTQLTAPALQSVSRLLR